MIPVIQHIVNQVRQHTGDNSVIQSSEHLHFFPTYDVCEFDFREFCDDCLQFLTLGEGRVVDDVGLGGLDQVISMIEPSIFKLLFVKEDNVDRVLHEISDEVNSGIRIEFYNLQNFIVREISSHNEV